METAAEALKADTLIAFRNHGYLRRVRSGDHDVPGRVAWAQLGSAHGDGRLDRLRKVILIRVCATVVVVAGVGFLTAWAWFPTVMVAVLMVVLAASGMVRRVDHRALWLEDRALAAWQTADRLSVEATSDWVVLHDRAVPGTDLTIDHLVIAPSGVWVITSERSEGTVRIIDDELWYVTHGLEIERVGVGDTAVAARDVAGALAAHLVAAGVDDIGAVVAVWGARCPRYGLVAERCAVIPGRSVGRMIATAPTVFDAPTISCLAVAAASRFPPAIVSV